MKTMEEADYGICGVMGKTRSPGRCRNARGNQRGNFKKNIDAVVTGLAQRSRWLRWLFSRPGVVGSVGSTEEPTGLNGNWTWYAVHWAGEGGDWAWEAGNYAWETGNCAGEAEN